MHAWHNIKVQLTRDEIESIVIQFLGPRLGIPANAKWSKAGEALTLYYDKGTEEIKLEDDNR